MSVYKKLQDARVMLQSKQLKKTGHNKFAGYYYFELGDFLPTVNEIFGGLGLCAVISYGKDLATMTIKDIDGDGEIVITSPMAEANLKGCHPIQNLGAVETYTRRYLYVTALEIVEHDAIDSSEPTGIKKHAGASSKSVAQSTLESMPDDEQRFLKDEADKVKAAYHNGAEAGFIEYKKTIKKLDADEQVAIFSFFDSKQRSFIDKQIEKERKEAEEIAAQTNQQGTINA